MIMSYKIKSKTDFISRVGKTGMYKSRLGGYKEADEKHDAEGYLIDKYVFEKMGAYLDALISEFNGYIKQSESELLKAKGETAAVRRYWAEQATIEKKVAEEQSASAQKAWKETAAVKDILRRKGNQLRGVPGRAKGYVVVSCEENRKPVGTFKSVISTPWPNSLPIDAVKDFCVSEKLGGLLSEIFEWQSDSESTKQMRAKKSYEADGKPASYQLRFRTGRECWEAVVYHFGFIQYGKGGRSFVQDAQKASELASGMRSVLDGKKVDTVKKPSQTASELASDDNCHEWGWGPRM